MTTPLYGDSPEAQIIAEHIELDRDHSGLKLDFDPTLGFAYTTNAQDRDATPYDIIGFIGDTGQTYEQGTYYQRVLSPRTEWSELSSLERKREKGRLKGIGPRVRSLPEDMLDTQEEVDEISVVAFALNPEAIIDLRKDWHTSTPGKYWRLARHLGRATTARLIGPEREVARIHRKFGLPDEVDAVIEPQPYKTEIVQSMKGNAHPGIVQPQLMIIRNPFILLRRIGIAKI